MPNSATVTCAGGTTSTSQSIQVEAIAGAPITITWTAQNAEFPSNVNEAFQWKSAPHPPERPTLSPDRKQLILTYVMPPRSIKWQYNIKLANCKQLDPEIDNVVKPPTEDELPGRPKTPKQAQNK